MDGLCAPGYYPPGVCAVFCDDAQCGGHGACGRLTGACECYASATLGFWAGALCDECATGYTGANCTATCRRVVECGRHPL